jgi:hypothetical protein
MPFDEESERAARGTRSLGRGLEDVSRLFVPQTSEAGAREPASGRASEQAAVRPNARAGAAVLRLGDPVTRDQLIATLRECQGALDGGMRTVDTRIPCGPRDEIDLFALDRTNQLTIVDVEIAPGDGLLLRGVGHVDWVNRHRPLVQRLYPDWMIDASRPPRLVLVAPQFSPLLRNAVRQITRPDIACFRYHGVALSGGTGILFEPVAREREEPEE